MTPKQKQSKKRKVMHEYVALVDENDRIIRKVLSEYVRNNSQWARVTTIILKNSKNEILLQQRSKKVNDPLLWSTSAGGYVDYGETYQQAAKREMFEEIGVDVPLKKLVKFKLENSKKHYALFIGFCEGPFKKNHEVKQVKFFTYSAILQDIKKHPKKFKKTFIKAFLKYGKRIKNAKNKN